mmetsp:Transcript_10389/g.27223  ORF Transcript_10389/g.27223 Transcript_10389/m.27223 type:complete len:197 (+) Transcript_10389:37-627(+)
MGNSGSRGRRGQQYSDKKGKRKSHGRKASGAGLGKSPHADAVGGLAPVERSRLLCGSDDCNVVLYDLAGKNIVQRWEGHTRPVTKVCAAPGGEAFFSASRDLSLKMWREGAADEVGSFRGHELTVSAVAVSKDGSTLVSGSRDYSVRQVYFLVLTVVHPPSVVLPLLHASVTSCPSLVRLLMFLIYKTPPHTILRP